MPGGLRGLGRSVRVCTCVLMGRACDSGVPSPPPPSQSSLSLVSVSVCSVPAVIKTPADIRPGKS